VTGYPIQVYKVCDEKPSLAFVKQDEFDAPNNVVVYEQLDQGAMYPKGQLWWRPLDNFIQHFTPLE